MNLTKGTLRKIFLQKRNNFVHQNQALLTDSFFHTYSKTVHRILNSNAYFNSALKNGRSCINIGGFYPVKNEVNCLAIFKGLNTINKNLTFSLPIVPSTEERALKFREFHDKSKLVIGKYNIAVPSEDSPLVQPDVLLVPLLCFDKTCYRLGYGKGFYDCTIDTLKANNKHLITVGLAFDVQEHDYVITEPHDVQLDYIATESRLIQSKSQVVPFFEKRELVVGLHAKAI